MIANNSGGALDDRITATQSALEQLESCFTDDETKLSIRKARKQVQKTSRGTIRQEMARGDGAVVNQFSPRSPQPAARGNLRARLPAFQRLPG